MSLNPLYLKTNAFKNMVLTKYYDIIKLHKPYDVMVFAGDEPPSYFFASKANNSLTISIRVTGAKTTSESIYTLFLNKSFGD